MVHFAWEIPKITILNPQMWIEMAIVIGPLFAGLLVFVWYQRKYPETGDELYEEVM